MNCQIPTEVALRVKDKLDEYLKLAARLEELEKDPDLLPFRSVKPKPINNPPKPAMRYVEEVFASLPENTVLDTYELISRMKEIGYHSTAEKTYLTVYGILRRESKKEKAKIIKIGSKWRIK